MASSDGQVQRRPSLIIAVFLLVAALALLLLGQSVRSVEALAQATLLNLGGLGADAMGQAVIFPLDGRWVGVGFSVGCSVAPLTALFLGGSAAAAWMRPLRLRSVALGVGALVLVFMIANQLRIATIVAMMKTMGFERGYEFSHVFLGSAISTIGFVAAVLLFVRLILRDPARMSAVGA
ncbi:exosortase/archaeosortase family protein [Ornithinimicrobium cryptoxanthini]|uniref:Exosortase/archaeosortase family protein n=1 Tax=Ornithinimicrobium cryptoxanthini TaxID=2934161 RepID=A0ABY4YHR8_9MICO|nr:exosortase/archaeosortase family protein [Ornithinimicrobium cryptoxanthini]USQ76071.1 exosortase/archaeosortase family protein [Ornithinimicrobium cryptoxanthini]